VPVSGVTERRLDEPYSALDPTSTRRARHAQCALLPEENTPGHIVEYGPTAELFDNPSAPRTADHVHGRFG
jgi:phosphate transport system ATP-binding protein